MTERYDISFFVYRDGTDWSDVNHNEDQIVVATRIYYGEGLRDVSEFVSVECASILERCHSYSIEVCPKSDDEHPKGLSPIETTNIIEELCNL